MLYCHVVTLSYRKHLVLPHTFVPQLEEAVEAEPGLTDAERTLLRASAYDAYDMRVLAGEFVHREQADPSHLLMCLELLAAIAAGSDAHVQVLTSVCAGIRGHVWSEVTEWQCTLLLIC